MAKLQVEVAAALPDQQVVIALVVEEGTTVLEAINASGIRQRLPDLLVDEKRLGIFGRVCRPERVLREGDRAEIYRPLTADPKEVRRQLAELERAAGKGRP
jgi:putative ubiquitin-RnfH superfamily antitoxin RatB of RatAB toxin-antitoxin module